MFKKLIVHLTNHKPKKQPKHMSLVFRIRPIDLAQRWVHLIKEILPQGVREKNRFVGFCNDFQSEIAKRKKNITSLVDALKPIHPEIDFGQFNFKGSQDEINRFHTKFVDSNLAKQNHPKSFPYWNALNNELHTLEWLFGSQKKAKDEISSTVIYVTFYRKKLEDLTEQHYENSTLNQNFGTIYLNYSQVGRHVYDIFCGQDNNIPLDQIKLFNKFSADFFIYLGPHQGHSYHLQLLNKMKDWFYINKDMFSKLELSWDPGKLCLGHIPVASLEHPLYSQSEIISFQKTIADFQEIESVEIV